MVVVMYGFVVAAALIAVRAVSGGDDATLLTALSAALFFGPGGVYLMPPRWSSRPEITIEGLVLRHSRWVTYAPPAIGLGMGATCLALPDEGWPLRVVGVVVLVVMLGTLVLSRGRRAVVLTPHSIQVLEPRYERTAGWDEVHGVRVYDRVENYKITVYRPHVGLGPLDVPVWRLAVGPTVAYWTLRFYAEHPEARDELLDRRSYDRVVAGDLTGGSGELRTVGPDQGPGL